MIRRATWLLSWVLLAVAGGRVSAQVPSIVAGQAITGRLEASDPVLEDDSHYDLYRFQGEAGERILIRL